jgi:peptide/nickel transport system permease protein
VSIGAEAGPTRPGTSRVQTAGRFAPMRLVRSLLGAAATVLVTTLVIYTCLALAPGDPVTQILGGRATEEAREALREELGLDQPVLVRYAEWIAGAVRGDFGRSYTYRQDVGDLLAARAETTVLLVVYAGLLTAVIGLALGIAGGVSRRIRPVVNVVSSLGVSVPAFVAAGLLTSLFAVQLGVFPTFGAGSGFADRIVHLTLPAASLAIGYSAYLARITSAVVAEQAEKEFVMTSIGRGIPFATTLRRHILPNAALPVLTVGGLVVAGLVAGAVVVEKAFAIDGIGSLLVTSVFTKDYAVVTAISLVIVVVFVVVTTLIDLAQAALDPRQREFRR